MSFGLRLGSPPRARGAGLQPPLAHAHQLDHPRVRGEQITFNQLHIGYAGSPPRARGAGVRVAVRVVLVRITPACAGSRGSRRPPRLPTRDHPRVRGEQTKGMRLIVHGRGSPPRARGAGPAVGSRADRSGITPACAGSRVFGAAGMPLRGDHPRVRGEQQAGRSGAGSGGGSPPRARGAGLSIGKPERDVRITPACAGSRSLG